MGWIETISALGARDHAETLGLTVRGRTASPCPKCGTAQRGSEDRRGPLGFTGSGEGWTCHAKGCDASGDLADLLAYRVAGTRLRDLSEDDRARVREEATRLGWLTSTNLSPLYKSAASYGVGAIKRTSGPAPDPVSKAPTGAQGSTGRYFRWRETLPGGAVKCLWTDPDAAPVLEYLTVERALPEEVIRSWGLGAMLIRGQGRVVERWATIPLCNAEGTPVNVRFRRVPGPCLYCSEDGVTAGPGCDRCKTEEEPDGTGRVQMRPKYRVCPDRPMPLFGSDRLKAGEPVVVTEGEMDVIALSAYGWHHNVVSGTTGGTAEWPDSWLDAVEGAPSFVLALDDDAVGQGGASKLADKLGRYRCAHATLPRKDAGECLSSGVAADVVRAALLGPAPMIGLEIGRASDYYDEIEDMVADPNRSVGEQCSSAMVNKAIGGFLPGLYVISGETGHGKSTWTTWILWDLMRRTGEGLFLTSFENGPAITITDLLRMELGRDYRNATPEERREALERLDANGMMICKHYGDVSDVEVFDVVRYVRRRLGCRSVMLDHLDFMVRQRRPGEDEREAKERVIRDLAIAAKFDDIRIFLIVHPNNLSRSQQRRVEIGDVKGASAIRQDAHNGIIIERMDRTKDRPFPATMVYFDKVRSKHGRAGSKVLMAYDPLSCHYADSWEETPSGRANKRVVTP